MDSISNTYYLNNLILDSKLSKTSIEISSKCTNRIKSSVISKYFKNIPFIHKNLTVYRLPVNLNDLECMETLSYLIKYSKIPEISKKQIKHIFNKHKYDYFLNVKNLIHNEDFILEEDDLLNALKEFLNGNIKNEGIKNMLEHFGLLNSKLKLSLKEKFTDKLVYGYDIRQFEAICAFSERYFDKLNKFSSFYDLVEDMSRLLEKLDLRLLNNCLDSLYFNKQMLNLLMFLGEH